MARTKAQWLNLADSIQNQIKTGKIVGKEKVLRARRKMYNLRWEGKKAGLREASSVAIKKPIKQGFLPNFLSQMNMVHIEEMVAQKLFEAIMNGELQLNNKAGKNDSYHYIHIV